MCIRDRLKKQCLKLNVLVGQILNYPYGKMIFSVVGAGAGAGGPSPLYHSLFFIWKVYNVYKVYNFIMRFHSFNFHSQRYHYKLNISGTFFSLCDNFLDTCETKLPTGAVSNNNRLDIVVLISDPHDGVAAHQSTAIVSYFISLWKIIMLSFVLYHNNQWPTWLCGYPAIDCNS